ncbi:hypothetical protein R6Q59_024077, partial [Mikania micrantha]
KEEVKVFQTVELYAFELACRLFMSLEDPNHIAKLAAIRTKLATIIKTRRAELHEGKASPSQDLLSHFLTSSDENGTYLTEKEIANNILLLLFAGHDTSTVSITLLMKTLGEHPDVYDKVLKEVTRLNPPIDGAYREALVDIEYAGYTFPKGWKVTTYTFISVTYKTNKHNQ